MSLQPVKLPSGIVLSPVARQVFAVLERHTAFPWPILAAQCKRASLAPELLLTSGLPTLIPLLAAGVGRFTSPEKEAAVKRELSALLTGAPPPR